MIDKSGTTSVRGQLAVRLRDVIRSRWPDDVQAVGVRGSVAHGDDADGSDVNLVVITYRPKTGPKSALRMVDGVPVDLHVMNGEQGLGQARMLYPDWPLQADGLLTTYPLYDPDGWFTDQREAHLTLLTEARAVEFAQLARHNWAIANGAHARAVRLAQSNSGGVSVLAARARLHAALVAGLLTRIYFRNQADAVNRTAVADADLQELGAILKYQAEELAARNRPVDGTLGALFD